MLENFEETDVVAPNLQNDEKFQSGEQFWMFCTPMSEIYLRIPQDRIAKWTLASPDANSAQRGILVARLQLRTSSLVVSMNPTLHPESNLYFTNSCIGLSHEAPIGGSKDLDSAALGFGIASGLYIIPTQALVDDISANLDVTH